MGPRQSVPLGDGASSGATGGPRGSVGRSVRTGAMNSTLVHNFDLFPLGGDAAALGTPRTPRGGATPSQTPRKEATPPRVQEPQTTPFCIRYMYQGPKKSQQQQQHGNQKQVPLPSAPATGVSVDLFDGDGKHVANLPLNASDGEFFTVTPVTVPAVGEKPLTQYFRFVVDGRRGQNHPHLPVATMPSGELANFVTVTNPETDAANSAVEQQQTAVSKDAAAATAKQQQQQPGTGAGAGATTADDDEVGWSQNPPQFEETRKFPPIMPPHLRYTPLNAPPSQIRCDGDGNIITDPMDDDVVLGPEHRPSPLSVTINHCYFQRREDHTLVGITTRYQDKCTSIAYYKHDPLPAGAIPFPSGTPQRA